MSDPTKQIHNFASFKHLSVDSLEFAKALDEGHGEGSFAHQFNIPSCLDAACGLELANGTVKWEGLM